MGLLKLKRSQASVSPGPQICNKRSPFSAKPFANPRQINDKDPKPSAEKSAIT